MESSNEERFLWLISGNNVLSGFRSIICVYNKGKWSKLDLSNEL